MPLTGARLHTGLAHGTPLGVLGASSGPARCTRVSGDAGLADALVLPGARAPPPIRARGGLGPTGGGTPCVAACLP
eukprot:2350717-Lingulodinium_polyedra.AAC.1